MDSLAAAATWALASSAALASPRYRVLNLVPAVYGLALALYRLAERVLLGLI